MRIIEFIPTGKRNAVDIQRLIRLTGKTQRECARLIREERCNGAVILTTSKGGYWLPDYTDSDIAEQFKEFIRYMDSKNTFQAVKSARIALHKIETEHQTQIGGV